VKLIFSTITAFSTVWL